MGGHKHHAKRTFFVASIALMLSCLPAAAVEEGVDGIGWVEALDRKLTVAVHQEPPRFFDHLYRIDADRLIEFRTVRWTSFWDADIWVYFIADAGELGYLPDYVQGFVEESETRKTHPEVPYDLLFGRRFFRDQHGEIRSIVFAVFFVDSIRSNIGDDVSCHTAGLLNLLLRNQVSRFTNSREIPAC